MFKQLGDDASLGTAKVGRVDCTVHKETCGKFGVKGYPTLKVIQNGKYFDYKGARGLKELKAFLTKEHVAAEGTDVGKAAVEEKKPAAAASGGASKVVVLTDANFDELVVKSDKQWLVKFYAPVRQKIMDLFKKDIYNNFSFFLVVWALVNIEILFYLL